MIEMSDIDLKILEQIEEIKKRISINNKFKENEEDEELDSVKMSKVNAEKIFNNINSKEYNSNILNCDLCKNRRYIPKIIKNEFGYFDVECNTCECNEIYENFKYMDYNGLLDLTKNFKLKDFTIEYEFQEKILEKANDYIQKIKNGNNSWFLICGQSGCGKTHICISILNELKKNYKCSYMNYAEIINNNNFGFMTKEEIYKYIKIYLECEILVIDDLFKYFNDKKLNLVYKIINERYLNKKLINIISSEYYLDDFFNIDKSLHGRILEKCGDSYLQISVEDFKNFRINKIN